MTTTALTRRVSRLEWQRRVSGLPDNYDFGRATLEVSVAEMRDILCMLGEIGWYEPWWQAALGPDLDRLRLAIVRDLLTTDQFAAWEAERDDYHAGRKPYPAVFDPGWLHWWVDVMGGADTRTGSGVDRKEGDDEHGNQNQNQALGA